MIRAHADNPLGLRVRQRLGKYRIEKSLAEGGFAKVYQALDTIEGVRVALKVPGQRWVSNTILEDFRKEVRLAARLDHPHILPIKNAEIIEGRFVIAYPLGEQTLGHRLQRRLSTVTAIQFAEQMMEAVACAHRNRIIHCDVKPENFILFPNNVLRLTDFGIAKVAFQTLRGSGSGTVGYVAPEQAMGKPSFRSDVFSLGLILYRMFSGQLPEWPYEWPPPGFQRLRSRLHADLIDFLRRAIAVDPKKRFHDAEQMWQAFRRIKARCLRHARRSRGNGTAGGTTRDWRTVRRRQFLREYGAVLDTRHTCKRCDGPVSEVMVACPWCGDKREAHVGETQFPCHCPRCRRGMKLDWRYCPWCYGSGFQPHSPRPFSDARYAGRCSNARCRKDLMPFMRYCPWCNRKVRRKWQIPGGKERCRCCGWGVLGAYWSFCPWCAKSLIAT